MTSMKITLTIEGGFAYVPALHGPRTVDTATLDQPSRQMIETMVKEARFFDLPQHLAAPRPGAADIRTTVITIEDNGQVHEVRRSDPLVEASLARLVAMIRNLKPIAGR
jgi:hypothetical protein